MLVQSAEYPFKEEVCRLVLLSADLLKDMLHKPYPVFQSETVIPFHLFPLFGSRDVQVFPEPAVYFRFQPFQAFFQFPGLPTFPRLPPDAPYSTALPFSRSCMIKETKSSQSILCVLLMDSLKLLFFILYMAQGCSPSYAVLQYGYRSAS